MDSASKIDNNKEANRVLEYYRKYCQNPDLIKYFTGPEASFVGEKSLNIQEKSSLDNRQLYKPSMCDAREEFNCENEQSHSPESSNRENIQSGEQDDDIVDKNQSRSSSVASNKIEWDNGADIGYKNSYMFLSNRKSASFPNLLSQNLSLNTKVIPKEVSEKSMTENVEELRKMYHQLTFSSDTSSSTNKEMPPVSPEQITVSSSSQGGKSVKTSTKSSSSSTSYLKKRIGYPVAYSTPHEQCDSKESTSKSSEDPDAGELKGPSSSSSKVDGYTVTPMISVPVKPKRNFNSNKLFMASDKNSFKEPNSSSSLDKKDASRKNIRKHTVEKDINNTKKKIDLCLTKPVFLECISLECKKSVHKDVQTSFLSEKSSKCVQTEEIQPEPEAVNRYTPQIQNIEYIKCRSERNDVSTENQHLLQPSEFRNNDLEDPKNPEKDANICKATQTHFVLSNKSKKNINSANAKKLRGREVPLSKTTNCGESTELSSANTFSNDTEATNDNFKSPLHQKEVPPDEVLAEEMLLAEMISLNYSKDLNTDIKRSINVLQKLLKSRKYDQATKKFYIKKIVQKIVDSKYSDDSSSSELFRPKNFHVPPNFEEKASKNTKQHKSSAKLMDNLPWYPASEPKHSLPKKKSENREPAVIERIASKTVNQRNVCYDLILEDNQTSSSSLQKEHNKVSSNQVGSTKESPTSSDLSAPSNQKHKNRNSRQEMEKLQKERDSKVTSYSSSKLAYDSLPERDKRHTSSEGKIGCKDWRTNKTLSEKLVENRNIIDFKKGQGDYLLDVVKKERYHQLSWINNEIEHLVKLKELLEKRPEYVSPDSKLKEVLSSLLKMKEKDMKGIAKNFEVFICNSTPKENTSKLQGVQKQQKKTACLTPGYYTIETQLDPEGNLLDLTVYDGSGKRKYNYRTDGIVDDVSISSRQHNTEVKLKPKTGDFSSRPVPCSYRECCECGRSFMASTNDSDVSLCQKCTAAASRFNTTTPKATSTKNKACKTCLNLFIPSLKNKNICSDCFDEEPEPDLSTRQKFKDEICQACGRMLVHKDDDSLLCLCRRCKRNSIKGERKPYQPMRMYNFCKYCGRKYLGSDQYSDESICGECFKLSLQKGMKCACKKNTFDDEIVSEVCKCGLREFPTDEMSKEIDIEANSAIEICKICGVDLNQCICGPKFVPKTPKMVGLDVDASPLSTQAKMSVRGSEDKVEKKHWNKEDSTSKYFNFPEDDCSEYCLDSKFGKNRLMMDLAMLCPSSSQSSKVSIELPPRKKMVVPSSQQSRTETFPELKTSPLAHGAIGPKNPIPRKEALLHSPLTEQRESKNKTEAVKVLLTKKSCQCCTCTNCAVQTKRRGDKNARCQCCVCENCGTQASLDGNGINRKINNSKWCQQINRNHFDSDKKKRDERGTVPAGESESCESLDYPCKPLKPKVSAIKEDPSEESFTCPSKRVICPAKPPPCPGAGDKPCPSFPAKPCPSRRRTNLEEPQGSISTKSERHCKDRRRSRENESILLPVSIQSQSPIDQIDNNSKISNPSEISSRDFQTLDQIPSGPIFSPSKPEENFPTKNQPEEKFPPKNEPEVYMYQTEDQDVLTQPSGCSCGLETCKCNQTSTHEEKIIQCPAFKQCTCQTETKDDANVQCSCKEDVALSCQCKEPYEGRKVICECKPSTTSSSSKSNAGSDSVMSCICCKRGKILKNIINQIPLCEPCHKINRKNFYPHDYCNPLHSCMCYKLIDRNLLCQFKQTLTELERLDIYQQYCEILKNCKCCKKCGCKCKLPKKFKNGCAYFLKLEEACPNTECEGEGSFNSFNTEEDQENYLPEVTMKVPNCRASCARRKGRNGAAAKKYWSCPSIQNYLCTMKPEFVARAENRRRILRDATIQREENSDKRKLNFIDKVNYLNQRRAEKVSSETDILKPYGYQTKTYCVFDIELNESPKKVQPRVFKSFKEMKELTRRKYLHLNEVKNKKNVYREQRLREANRLLANTFTRRLQKSTLKGAVDIPLNVKVISY